MWLEKHIQNTWHAKIVGIFVIIFMLRIMIYGGIMMWVHDYASDHVFLGTSLVAQVQIVLAVAGHAFYSGKDVAHKAFSIIVLCWILFFAIFYETFITAKYYHTVLADIVGFFIGLVIFGTLSFLWTEQVDYDIYDNRATVCARAALNAPLVDN